ncbi:MAG: 7-cyano-7-deazaguanine synthase [Acidobacteriota bacterium]
MDTLVLLSGGLDSAVLLAHEARQRGVYPVYVAVGLWWEPAERRMLDELLKSPAYDGRVAPLETVEFSMRDVYPPTHWAIQGTPPAYDTPDEDVYLTGRNVVFLAKAGVVAAGRRLARIALGTLSNNPFPDATPAFFQTMASALSLGLNHSLEVVTPLASMHKEDVIRLGESLQVPMHLTLSCMNPTDGPLPLHCGQCSKCRERRDAFQMAGVEDRTLYAHVSPR